MTDLHPNLQNHNNSNSKCLMKAKWTHDSDEWLRPTRIRQRRHSKSQEATSGVDNIPLFIYNPIFTISQNSLSFFVQPICFIFCRKFPVWGIVQNYTCNKPMKNKYICPSHMEWLDTSCKGPKNKQRRKNYNTYCWQMLPGKKSMRSESLRNAEVRPCSKHLGFFLSMVRLENFESYAILETHFIHIERDHKTLP